MHGQIIDLDNNTNKIAEQIKLLFKNKCEYVVIENNNTLEIDKITPYYEVLNSKIGIVRQVGTDSNQNNYWAPGNARPTLL